MMPSQKNQVLFAVSRKWHSKLFSDKALCRINSHCNIVDADIPGDADKKFLIDNIAQANIVISSWHTACFDAEVLSHALNLQLITHAAGSVKPILSDYLWSRGVKVTSASMALAYGVAEFCLGLILTVPKRAFWGILGTRQGSWREGLDICGGPFEIYGQKIGVIGAGYCGKHLIKLLQNFECEILLYDPYISDEHAQNMSVVKVETLEELFNSCRVVSLNAPSTKETKHMIRGKHFRLLPDGAVFINTARGAVVKQDEMVRELEKGGFVACLDVTDPDCPPADHPLRKLNNVMLTPHMAGAIAENLLRIGTFVADEIEAFVKNKPLHFEVRQEDFRNIG